MADAESFKCRMYEKQFPDVDEAVMVNVRSVAEMGAYVTLMEYGNIEGMILLSELSRRRIRSIPKLIRVGKSEVAVVLRVDKEKGYIDLSKRRVTPEDIAKCEDKFNKSKTVHSIMRHVSDVTKVPLEKLYTQFGWPLYKKYGHAIEAFKHALTEPDAVLGPYDLPSEVRDALLGNLRRRLTPQPLKLRADIEVTCFTSEGVEAIRTALRAGEATGTEEMPVKIKLVAPPLYVMVTMSTEKARGLEVLQNAIEAVKRSIEVQRGTLNVKIAPRSVTERDEQDFQQLINTLEQQNKEVDGDDENSNSEDETPDRRKAARSASASGEGSEEGGEGEDDGQEEDE